MADAMVIDDDQVMRDAIAQMLEMDGVSVVKAENGSSAMKILKDGYVKLVITDIIMPEKEGLETIGFLRMLEPPVQIIAISGGGKVNAQAYLDLAKSLGAKFTFSKPFDRESFMIAVRNCLGIK